MPNINFVISSFSSDRRTCPVCNETFSDRKSKRRHMKRRNSENLERYKCAHCGLIFKDQDPLRRHEKEKHSPLATFEKSTISSHHQCKFGSCEKDFKRKSQLTRHQETVHGASETMEEMILR